MLGDALRWIRSEPKKEPRDFLHNLLDVASERLWVDGIKHTRVTTPDVPRANLITIYHGALADISLDDVVAAWEQVMRDNHRGCRVRPLRDAS